MQRYLTAKWRVNAACLTLPHTYSVFSFLTFAHYCTEQKYKHVCDLTSLTSTLASLCSSYLLSALTRIHVFREAHGWILMCINVSTKMSPWSLCCSVKSIMANPLCSSASPVCYLMVMAKWPQVTSQVWSQLECSHKHTLTPYLHDTDTDCGHPVLCNYFYDCCWFYVWKYPR